MPVLLVVHHTTSPTLQELLDAVLDGTRADGIDGVDVRVRAALTASSKAMVSTSARRALPARSACPMRPACTTST